MTRRKHFYSIVVSRIDWNQGMERFTCVRPVTNSSNVSLTGDTIRFRWFWHISRLTPIICRSEVFLECTAITTAELIYDSLRIKEMFKLSSRSAPMKLVPLSLQMSDGQPRRAVNRRRAAMKASVVESDTSSR